MAESALLTKIVAEYCAQNEELRFQQGLLDAFCQYAAQWFIDNSCVGLGHAASGLTLRFADGNELSLFAQPETATSGLPAVQISGTVDKKATKTFADTNPPVQITGRQ